MLVGWWSDNADPSRIVSRWGGVQYMPDKGQFGCVLVEIDDKDTDRKKVL